jgi:uncharacterized membrane protein
MKRHTRLLIAACSLIALVASAASLYVHYRLIIDPSYASFCDVNETVSCEAVYRSDYATMFGVPVAAGGAIWSAFVLLLSAYGMRDSRDESASRVSGYIFLSSIIGLAAVFYFAYTSFFVLHKTCLLCVTVYVAVLAIFFISSAAAPATLKQLPARLGGDLKAMFANPTSMTLAAVWVVASLALVALFPTERIGDRAEEPALAELPVETLDSAQLAEWEKWLDAQERLPAAAPSGDVKVLVLKFNDYQCPACRQTWAAYKGIIAKYEASHPGVFKFETRDFPLEAECGAGGIHSSACEAAVAVRLARASNRDKQLEEWLFARQSTMSRDLVKQGLAEVANVNNFDAEYPKVLEQVRADAQLGQRLGVSGTPTFFINGVKVPSLRPAYFDAAIAHFLKKSGEVS